MHIKNMFWLKRLGILDVFILLSTFIQHSFIIEDICLKWDHLAWGGGWGVVNVTWDNWKLFSRSDAFPMESFHSCLCAHNWIIPETLPHVVCLMVARSWLVQVLHVLPQVFVLLKWHWLPGVSSWLVRVIPYSTLSWSTQSYRVRLRAVIFSNMDGIYRKMLYNQNVAVM